MIGRTLGHYRILEKVGAGGMGEVYRARDERLERDVAVKILPAGLLADEAARKRFRHEALALARLNHPNVQMVFDFGNEAGVDYLVTEFVPGTTLTDKLAAGPLGEREVGRLGAQLADGLQAAHAQRVVHRDLKPGNLRLTPEGTLKILDFGLARLLKPLSDDTTSTTDPLTDHNAVAGTLPYMAPEQLRGDPADARTDIYAVGVVLYELATGRRPFQAELASTLTDAILHQPPVPPLRLRAGLSPRLEDIILKCLEKDPERRYHSARELGIDLRRLEPGTALPTPPSLQASAWGKASRRPTRRGVLVVVGILLMGLVALFFALRSGRWIESWLGEGEAPTTAAPASIRSLAVLPLENLSGDPEQEYFADGMTESLITDLAQISALKVISRTSVMQYKNTTKRLPEIGRELGVDAVVEGSVQRAGGRVKITAQLIEAATDHHLWAQSYERDGKDVLTLEDEVARAVAQEIRVQLTPSETSRLIHARPVNPEAYDAYLKGRYYWDKRTETELDNATDDFKQAIAEDPSYAPAYSGLADVYVLLNIRGYRSPSATATQAKAAAQKAVELDDNLAEAHTSLARVLMNDWDWPGAEREFKRALELNPGYVEAHHAYSHYLMAVGRTEESLSESKRALELAPLDPTMIVHLGWAYLFTGQVERAIELQRRAVELDSNLPLAHQALGRGYEERGMYAEALAEFQKALALSRDSPETLTDLGHAFASSGRRQEALNVLDQLAALSRRRYVSPFYRALLYAGLGDKNKALTYLEQAYEGRAAALVYLRIEPRLASLRSEPRFQALVAKMNFPSTP